MKLTPERLTELKTMAEHARSHFCIELAEAFISSVPALIADLEEAKEQLDSPYMDGYEAAKEEYRPQIIAAEAELAATEQRLSVIADELADVRAVHEHHCEELAATRKKLDEAQAREREALDMLGLMFGKYEHGSACFESPEDETVFLGNAIHLTEDQFKRITTILDDREETKRSALDAAIAEAINGEKQNPWKMAIINELIVSHILHTDHETDPIKALAALVDYECKVALDPVVSKEAQPLIEPYRKDTERLDWLEQQGHAYGFHDMHEGNRWVVEGPFATLRQLADAAIAAKGETNDQTYT